MSIEDYEFSEYLKSMLKYDSCTGVFTWISKPTKKVSIGDVAGCVNRYGYRVITINKKQYKEHRLAWIYSWICTSKIRPYK